MPRIAAWNDASSEETSRAYLQGRLRVLSRLMFWSYVAFIVGLWLLYANYPEFRPEWNGVIFTSGSIGVLILAVIWRLLLARRVLTIEALHRIDAFYAIGSGLVFGIGGVLALDFKPAPYGTLLYACLTVMSRAIVVPSTPRRTLILAALSFAPFVAASVIVANSDRFTDMPPAAVICAVTVICIVVALLAATGSKTTYGLRLEARAAMRLGQYTLDRQIGQGGMGTVYIASHALLRRPTAIKLLQPDRVGAENVDRFEREVQHMSQLTHPNTVAVFDYGRSPDGVFYYAMEYLDGIDLEKLVKRDGAQASDRVVMILAQVCGALHEAHAKGLVHRDIKPANIILCERGAVADVAKVVDFGLAQQITADSGGSSQILVGTPAYLAPEVVTDPDRVGAAADIYALGAVAYFLLSGKPMFEGKTAAELLIQHVTGAPRQLAEIAPVAEPLARLVMTCLSKMPSQRPSAEELARALRGIAIAADWDDASARAWWLAFRERQAEATTSQDPTLTITIDLGRRAA